MLFLGFWCVFSVCCVRYYLLVFFLEFVWFNCMDLVFGFVKIC